MENDGDRNRNRYHNGYVAGVFSMICVGYFSFRSFGVFDFVVEPAWYFGLFVSITCCGLLAGFIPSFRTVAKLKQAYRQET